VFRTLGTETELRSVYCAAKDQVPLAGLTVYSLCKNIVMVCSNVQKRGFETRQTMKEKRQKERKKRRSPICTLAETLNKY
jgi:hypothetical protein